MNDTLNKSSTKPRYSVFMNISQMDQTQTESNTTLLPHLKQIHEERTYNLQRDPKYTAQRFQTALKSNHKSEFEARILYESIKDFLFFQTFNQRNKESHFEVQAFINICKKMKYESFPAGQVIFKEGDEPNGKMYIVYEGEVAIVIKDQEFSDHHDGTSKKEQESKLDYQGARPGIEKAQKTFVTLMTNVTQPEKRPPTRPKIIVENADSRLERSANSLDRSDSGIQQEPLKLEEGESSPEKGPRKSKWAVIRDNTKMVRANTHRLSVPKVTERMSIVEKMPRQLQHNSSVSSHKRSSSGSRERKRKKEFDDMLVHEMIKMHGSLKDTISRGQFFGELALFDDTRRTATVITKTDCELLCIEKEDFAAIRSSFDRKKRIIQRFMTKYFPDLESVNTFNIVQALMYLMEEKSFDHGAVLAKEGEPGKKFFIIYEGACEIFKSIKIDQSCHMDSAIYKIKNYLRVGPVQKVDMPICKSEIGVFLSDEILFTKEPRYLFTVKTMTPQTVVFVIDRDKFLKRFPITVVDELDRANKQKLSGHQMIFKHMLKSRFPGCHMIIDPQVPFFNQQITIIQTQTERAKFEFAVAEQQRKAERAEAEGSPENADTARTYTEPPEKKLIRSNLLKQAFLHGLPEKQQEKNNAIDLFLRKTSAPAINGTIPQESSRRSKSPAQDLNQPLMSSVLDYKFLSEEELKVQRHRLDCVIKKQRPSKNGGMPEVPHYITPRIDQMIKRIQKSKSRNDISISAYKDATMLTAARVAQTEESFSIEDQDIIKHLIDNNSGDAQQRKTTTSSIGREQKIHIKVTTKGSVYPKVDMVTKEPNERFYYNTERSHSPANLDQAKRADVKNHNLFTTMLKRKHKFNSRVKRTLEQESSDFISFERVAL